MEESCRRYNRTVFTTCCRPMYVYVLLGRITEMQIVFVHRAPSYACILRIILLWGIRVLCIYFHELLLHITFWRRSRGKTLVVESVLFLWQRFETSCSQHCVNTCDCRRKVGMKVSNCKWVLLDLALPPGEL